VLGDEPHAESEERDDPDDEDYEELADQDGIHRGVPQTDNEDEESDDELLLRPYDDHVNNSQTETAMQPQKPSDGEAIAEQLIAAHLHEVLTLDEMLLREEGWSEALLRLEEPASNQVLYMIHERLLDIVEQNDCTRG